MLIIFLSPERFLDYRKRILGLFGLEKKRADHGSKSISSSMDFSAGLESLRSPPIVLISTQSPLKFMTSQILLQKYFKLGKQLIRTGILTDWVRICSNLRPTVITTSTYLKFISIIWMDTCPKWVSFLLNNFCWMLFFSQTKYCSSSCSIKQ